MLPESLGFQKQLGPRKTVTLPQECQETISSEFASGSTGTYAARKSNLNSDSVTQLPGPSNFQYCSWLCFFLIDCSQPLLFGEYFVLKKAAACSCQWWLSPQTRGADCMGFNLSSDTRCGIWGKGMRYSLCLSFFNCEIGIITVVVWAS
jgi:hypothetical protein